MINLANFISLPIVYKYLNKYTIYFSCITILLLLTGLWGGLVHSPADYQQGNTFRIIYIHVPAAFMSLAIYVFMAVNAAFFLIWRVKLFDIIASSCAFIGILMTICALVTGAIWGKPMWGAWWVWDARLTSELILLFLYLGYFFLRQSYNHRINLASKISSVLALVGVINIPIIHYSVQWWHTLHQGSTVLQAIINPEKMTMPWTMLWPLLTMILAFAGLSFIITSYFVRGEILLRCQGQQWIKKI